MRTARLGLAALGFAIGCSDNSAAPTSPTVTPRQPLASVTYQFPEEDPGPPFYALIERNFLPHTDDWAAVIFVRDPACIPGGFNLLDQIAVPQSFGCTSMVEGHVTYKNGPPPIDLAPWQVVMRGTGAVPVWFVSWADLQSAIADEALTIGELATMPSRRVGIATFFQMVQQPGPMRPQGILNGKIELGARGSLTNGTSFSIELREMGVDQVSVLRHIAIDFR